MMDANELVSLVRKMREAQTCHKSHCQSEADWNEFIEAVALADRTVKAVDAWLSAYDAHEAVLATSNTPTTEEE